MFQWQDAIDAYDAQLRLVRELRAARDELQSLVGHPEASLDEQAHPQQRVIALEDESDDDLGPGGSGGAITDMTQYGVEDALLLTQELAQSQLFRSQDRGGMDGHVGATLSS